MIPVAEAAGRAGRDPATIRRWIRSGRLAARKIRGRHMIEEAELDAALAEELRVPASWRRTPSGAPIRGAAAAVRRSRAGR